MTWNSFQELVNSKQTFLISSHLSPDGDCVGSQLALYWYLTSIGKEVTIYNQDPLPGKFEFLKNSDVMTSRKPENLPDVLVVIDCSNTTRLGWDTSPLAGLPVINIDHHRDNAFFGMVNLVDVKAAASGELIYRFFQEQGIAYPPEVAEMLYTAIMTDTGGFRFPNMTSGILRICADLSEKGAEPPKIYEKVYASCSRAALLLQSRVWSTLKFFFDGKVCCLEMPLSILDELGALYSDSEGMADITTIAADVQVGIMAKFTDSETHFSLRSTGMVDVGKIAQRIPGGGGHSSAAGCTLHEPYLKSLETMLAIVEQELK